MLPSSEGDADERVREGGLQAGDAQGLPAQALRPQAPGLHGGVARRPGRDRGQGLDRAGEDGIERQAHLAEHRRLPQHAELAGPVLAQVEVGGPDLVRVARERRQQRRQGHEDREPPHGRTSTWLARGPSHGRTDGIDDNPVLPHQALEGAAPGPSPAARGAIPPPGARGPRQTDAPEAATLP